MTQAPSPLYPFASCPLSWKARTALPPRLLLVLRPRPCPPVAPSCTHTRHQFPQLTWVLGFGLSWPLKHATSHYRSSGLVYCGGLVPAAAGAPSITNCPRVLLPSLFSLFFQATSPVFPSHFLDSPSFLYSVVDSIFLHHSLPHLLLFISFLPRFFFLFPFDGYTHPRPTARASDDLVLYPPVRFRPRPLLRPKPIATSQRSSLCPDKLQ